MRNPGCAPYVRSPSLPDCDAYRIRGGGPAGCAAAIAALLEDAKVELIERSHFPRHKVCGEFLSPGVEGALTQLGLWSDFEALGPARIRRMRIRAGQTRKLRNCLRQGLG